MQPLRCLSLSLWGFRAIRQVHGTTVSSNGPQERPVDVTARFVAGSSKNLRQKVPAKQSVPSVSRFRTSGLTVLEKWVIATALGMGRACYRF